MMGFSSKSIAVAAVLSINYKGKSGNKQVNQGELYCFLRFPHAWDSEVWALWTFQIGHNLLFISTWKPQINAVMDMEKLVPLKVLSTKENR